jgi:chorismate mutase
MATRGIRGAITIPSDTTENVLSGVQELLDAIFLSNPDLVTDDIASIIFTTTNDIVSTFPALAARKMGWDQVPMMCAQEIPVPDSLPLCIRILILWNSEKEQQSIKHIYLRGAASLRPDLAPGAKV